MRRVPAPLLAILCVAAVQAVAWSVLLPAFQGPDEVEHYSYVQRIAETRQPTWSTLEDLPPGSGLSVETDLALSYGSFRSLRGNALMRPYATDPDEERFRVEVDDDATDAEQAPESWTPAFRNPPAYYLYEALAYAPVAGAGVVTRQYVLRWATIPFFLITVLMAWLLAGEVFGRRRWLQAVVALFVALQPLLAQLGGLVNPDAVVAAIYGVALWLAAVVVNRGLTRGRAAAIVATAVVALLVHPRAVPVVLILGAALAVLATRAVRARPGPRRLVFAGIAGATVVFLAAQAWYAVRGDVSLPRLREYASYVWQFYLPKPSFMTETVRADYGSREVFVDRLWSGYLTHDVHLAPGLLDAISVATMAAGVILLVTLVWRREAVRERFGLAVVLGVAVLGTLILLHAAAWRDLRTEGNPILTGRYLTPLLPVAGVARAAVAASLPHRIGPGAATAVLGLVLLLALGGFGAAVVRFHA